MKSPKPIALVVLDGWGESSEKRGNAILNAKLPVTKMLDRFYPKLHLQASGISVGLPWGECGNSEVGHQSMGTGQIIYQNLPKITRSIEDGSFYANPILKEAMQWTLKHNSRLHLMGLVSEGAVHSHINHLFALLEMAKEEGVKELFVHVITDGRDTPVNMGKQYIQQLEEKVKKLGLGQIATVAGRYYTMDRNNNWDRIQKGYDAMVSGEGHQASSALEAIENQYKAKIFDENIEPTVIVGKDGKPVGTMDDKDAVIFFNYREDRARQISLVFCEKEFAQFQPKKQLKNIFFAGMVEYEKGMPKYVAFPHDEIKTCLGEVLAHKGKTQLRIAETEKYAHVTYFFNGGKEKPYHGEEHILVQSKKVTSYAEVPEMSAAEITEKLLTAINEEKYDFILVNYANPDMVGHTGNLPASIKAVETVDKCLGEVIEAVLEKNGVLLITADHGNVEELINFKTGAPNTEHSSNPVPCWLVTPVNKKERSGSAPSTSITGILSDITPTVLDLFGIPKPEELTSDSLLPYFKE